MRLLQWHEARVVECGGAGAADVGRKAVEGEALGAGEPPPARGDGLAERRAHDLPAGKAAGNRAVPLDFKCDHVDAALVVVVAEAPALHGMDDGVFHTVGIIGNDSGFSKEAA